MSHDPQEPSYAAALRRRQESLAATRKADKAAARTTGTGAAPTDATLLQWARALAGATVRVQPSALAHRLVLCYRPAPRDGTAAGAAANATPALVEGADTREAFVRRCLELQGEQAELLGGYDRPSRRPQVLVLQDGDVTLTAQPAIAPAPTAPLTPAQMLRKAQQDAVERAKSGGNKDAFGQGRHGGGNRR